MPDDPISFPSEAELDKIEYDDAVLAFRQVRALEKIAKGLQEALLEFQSWTQGANGPSLGALSPHDPKLDY